MSNLTQPGQPGAQEHENEDSEALTENEQNVELVEDEETADEEFESEEATATTEEA